MGVDVGPSSADPQESHGELLFQKIMISVLSVLSFRKFSLIQLATLVMQGV